MNSIQIVKADYNNPMHCEHIVSLLDHYALDEMGGGQALTPHTKDNLCAALSKLPHAISFLAYSEKQPCGLANCFFGFSTFACRPLINIHDIVVHSEFRRMGIAQKLLKEIETTAKAKDCCKVTLEVLENNHSAKKAYEKAGFEGYELDPSAGKAMFWQKKIN